MHWNEHTEQKIIDRINRKPRRSALERWKRSRTYDTLAFACFVALAMLAVFAAWQVKW